MSSHATTMTRSSKLGPALERATRVLVVEDDPEMRCLLARVFRARGYEVLEATNGWEVVSLVEQASRLRFCERPDVVVSDVRMPQLDGLAMVRALRQARFPGPLILLTAFCDPELRSRAISLGASAVLDKPVDLPVLLTLVRQCLRPVQLR